MDKPIHRATLACHEWNGRNSIFQGKNVLFEACFILALMGRDDPDSISMFLARAQHESDYWFFLTFRVHLRGAKAVSNAMFMHQVCEIQLRCHPKSVAREVDMLGCADESPSCARGDRGTDAAPIAPRR